MQDLQKQGEMLRATTSDTAAVWAKAVQALLSNTMKFALNAAHDTLPHNANLQLWKKKDNAAFPLCGERQSLLHVLNNRKVARDLRHYNQRHDTVFQEIAQFIQPKLPPTSRLIADLSGGYEFPMRIVPTDLRPDIVWWDDQQKPLVLAELTISYETNFEAAAERKEEKYEELVTGACNAGYDTELITLEVGSRGVINPAGFQSRKAALNSTTREMSELMFELCKQL